MCFGGQSTATTNTSQTQQADPLMQKAVGNVLGPNGQNIANVANTPYDQAMSPQVAAQNAQQLQAIQGLGGIASNNPASPYIAQAADYATAAADPNNVNAMTNAYYNPMASQVMDQFSNIMGQQAAQLKGNEAASGAIGGSRASVANSTLANQQGLAAGQIQSQLYNQALQSALTTAGQQAGAAYSLGNLGQESLGTQLTGLNAGLTGGNLTQQQQQNILNAAQTGAIQETLFPQQELGAAANIAGIGTTLGGTTNGTSTTTQPVNYLGQILGAGIAGYGLYKSDERTKTDIKPIGKLYDGQTIYTYRHHGDPDLRIGLMAQEVERKHPNAVHEINGIKAVDYPLATEKSAQMGSKRLHRAIGGGTGIGDGTSGLQGYSGLQNPLQSYQGLQDPLAQATQLQVNVPQAHFPQLNMGQQGQNTAQAQADKNAQQEMQLGQDLGKSHLGSDINNSLGNLAFGSSPTLSDGGWSTSAQPNGGFIGGLESYLGLAQGGRVHRDDGGSIQAPSLPQELLQAKQGAALSAKESPFSAQHSAFGGRIHRAEGGDIGSPPDLDFLTPPLKDLRDFYGPKLGLTKPDVIQQFPTSNMRDIAPGLADRYPEGNIPPLSTWDTIQRGVPASNTDYVPTQPPLDRLKDQRDLPPLSTWNTIAQGARATNTDYQPLQPLSEQLKEARFQHPQGGDPGYTSPVWRDSPLFEMQAKRAANENRWNGVEANPPLTSPSKAMLGNSMAETLGGHPASLDQALGQHPGAKSISQSDNGALKVVEADGRTITYPAPEQPKPASGQKQEQQGDAAGINPSTWNMIAQGHQAIQDRGQLAFEQLKRDRAWRAAHPDVPPVQTATQEPSYSREPLPVLNNGDIYRPEPQSQTGTDFVNHRNAEAVRHELSAALDPFKQPPPVATPFETKIMPDRMPGVTGETPPVPQKTTSPVAPVSLTPAPMGGDNVTPPVATSPATPQPTPAQSPALRGFTPTVTVALNRAAQAEGIDPGVLAAFAKIESSGNPHLVNRYGHSGLFQLSRSEFDKWAPPGANILDPNDNAMAAARKLKYESAQFEQKYGHPPSAKDLYLIHQQGEGGYDAHLNNPSGPAWQNMAGTGEGRAKGPGWARRAIWGNIPDDQKRNFPGGVDDVTSADFVNLWGDKINRFMGGLGQGAQQAIGGLGQTVQGLGAGIGNTITGGINSARAALPSFGGQAPTQPLSGPQSILPPGAQAQAGATQQEPDATPNFKAVMKSLGFDLGDHPMNNPLTNLGIGMMAAGPSVGIKGPAGAISGALTSFGKGGQYAAQQDQLNRAQGVQLANAALTQQKQSIDIAKALKPEWKQIGSEEFYNPDTGQHTYRNKFGWADWTTGQIIPADEAERMGLPSGGTTATPVPGAAAPDILHSPANSAQKAEEIRRGYESIDPNLRGQPAMEALKQVDPARARRVEAILRGDAPLPTTKDMTSRNSLAMMDFDWAERASNGTVSAQTYPTILAVKNSFSKAQDSNNIQSGTRAVNHMFDQYRLVPYLNNTNWEYWNRNTGPGTEPVNESYRAAVSGFNTATNGVASELAKFFKGMGVSSEEEVKNWRQAANVYGAPNSQFEHLYQAGKLMYGQFEPLAEKYNAAFRNPHTGEYLPGFTPKEPLDFMPPESRDRFIKMMSARRWKL